MALVKIVEAPTSITSLVKDLKTVEDPDALDVIVSAYLIGVDTKMVKVYKGRSEYKEIEYYLHEIPKEHIVYARRCLDQIANGDKYCDILHGRGYQFLNRLCQVYPVMLHARAQANNMRASRRAEKALDRLETISETAESESAQVKACEVMLRATHPAFGHATEEKTGSSRPLITINIGAIYGQSVENLSKTSGEIVDLPN